MRPNNGTAMSSPSKPRLALLFVTLTVSSFTACGSGQPPRSSQQASLQPLESSESSLEPSLEELSLQTPSQMPPSPIPSSTAPVPSTPPTPLMSSSPHESAELAPRLSSSFLPLELDLSEEEQYSEALVPAPPNSPTLSQPAQTQRNRSARRRRRNRRNQWVQPIAAPGTSSVQPAPIGPIEDHSLFVAQVLNQIDVLRSRHPNAVAYASEALNPIENLFTRHPEFVETYHANQRANFLENLQVTPNQQTFSNLFTALSELKTTSSTPVLWAAFRRLFVPHLAPSLTQLFTRLYSHLDLESPPTLARVPDPTNHQWTLELVIEDALYVAMDREDHPEDTLQERWESRRVAALDQFMNHVQWGHLFQDDMATIQAIINIESHEGTLPELEIFRPILPHGANPNFSPIDGIMPGPEIQRIHNDILRTPDFDFTNIQRTVQQEVQAAALHELRQLQTRAANALGVDVSSLQNHSPEEIRAQLLASLPERHQVTFATRSMDEILREVGRRQNSTLIRQSGNPRS